MDHQQPPFDEPRPAGSHVYTFDGQMLIIAAIAFVFLFVVLLTSLHFYARWWLRNGQAFVVSGDHPTAAAALPGLDPAVLRSLSVFTYSSSEPGPTMQARPECAVCLSEFEEGETGRLLPKCNHSFHVDCIDMWFHSHSTCPLCRAPVEPGPVVVVIEINGPETGSSSGLCDTCQHEEEGCEESMISSLARRRKAATVKIDVEKPKIESESTTLQGGSPVMTSRMSSFKRLLSMGGMSSPSGSRMGAPRYRAAELDLESGLGEPSRVYTPK